LSSGDRHAQFLGELHETLTVTRRIALCAFPVNDPLDMSNAELGRPLTIGEPRTLRNDLLQIGSELEPLRHRPTIARTRQSATCARLVGEIKAKTMRKRDAPRLDVGAT
jgi:hypothetical protein